MPSLDSVTFDTSGLTFDGERDGCRAWVTPSGDRVTLHYFPIPPNISADVRSLAAVRESYRALAARGGAAIIEIDTLVVHECAAVRAIVKIPQQPSGMTYLGSITLPYRSFSFVLKIQCPEFGTTGIRDALIADELMGLGRITIDVDAHTISGWMQDPYVPTLTDGFRRNMSEDAKYDARFPAHPLSRLRPLLTRLQGTLRLASEVRAQPPFSFPPASLRRRWWQVW